MKGQSEKQQELSSARYASAVLSVTGTCAALLTCICITRFHVRYSLSHGRPHQAQGQADVSCLFILCLLLVSSSVCVRLMQDFMLGNKLFIVCEYIPHSLLQLLEGTAEPLALLTSLPSAGTQSSKLRALPQHVFQSISCMHQGIFTNPIEKFCVQLTWLCGCKTTKEMWML